MNFLKDSKNLRVLQRIRLAISFGRSCLVFSWRRCLRSSYRARAARCPFMCGCAGPRIRGPRLHGPFGFHCAGRVSCAATLKSVCVRAGTHCCACRPSDRRSILVVGRFGQRLHGVVDGVDLPRTGSDHTAGLAARMRAAQHMNQQRYSGFGDIPHERRSQAPRPSSLHLPSSTRARL